jgi:hypothetical protein
MDHDEPRTFVVIGSCCAMTNRGGGGGDRAWTFRGKVTGSIYPSSLHPIGIQSLSIQVSQSDMGVTRKIIITKCRQIRMSVSYVYVHS